MDVIIRRARRSDIPRLVELFQQLTEVEDTENPSVYERAFDSIEEHPDYYLLVAELEGEVVGTVSVHVLPGFGHKGRPIAFAEFIVVDSSIRGHGIGTKLLRTLAEIARAHGAYKLIGGSRMDRARSHELYERAGLVKFGYLFKMDLE